MPGDQQIDDSKSIVLLHRFIRKSGYCWAPNIHLSISSDKPAAQIAVRLNHIHPDGASTRITYGVFNLAHRKVRNGNTTVTR